MRASLSPPPPSMCVRATRVITGSALRNADFHFPFLSRAEAADGRTFGRSANAARAGLYARVSVSRVHQAKSLVRKIKER